MVLITVTIKEKDGAIQINSIQSDDWIKLATKEGGKNIKTVEDATAYLQTTHHWVVVLNQKELGDALIQGICYDAWKDLPCLLLGGVVMELRTLSMYAHHARIWDVRDADGYFVSDIDEIMTYAEAEKLASTIEGATVAPYFEGELSPW